MPMVTVYTTLRSTPLQVPLRIIYRRFMLNWVNCRYLTLLKFDCVRALFNDEQVPP